MRIITRGGQLCLWALCLLTAGVRDSHSFAPARCARPLGFLSGRERLRCCRARSGGVRESCATIATAKESVGVGGAGQADDPTRKKAWAVKRADGLQRAAAKGVVPLKYLEIQCPGEHSGEEAEPLLILHGLLGSSRNFQGFAKALSARLQRPRRIIIPGRSLIKEPYRA